MKRTAVQATTSTQTPDESDDRPLAVSSGSPEPLRADDPVILAAVMEVARRVGKRPHIRVTDLHAQHEHRAFTVQAVKPGLLKCVRSALGIEVLNKQPAVGGHGHRYPRSQRLTNMRVGGAQGELGNDRRGLGDKQGGGQQACEK